MLRHLAGEMERLDGDGLVPRATRPRTWIETVNELEIEASGASSLFQLGRVFRRLDAAYPNLHARTELHPQLDERASVGRVVLPLSVVPESVDEKYIEHRFFIKDPDLAEIHNGDEVLEINGRAMTGWAEENFNFCNFPLRSQCALEFNDNFQGELLSWDRHQPLSFTIRQGNLVKIVSVGLRFEGLKPRTSSGGARCGLSIDRYLGFRLVHEGTHLCAFEKSGTVVLRIRSFYYEDPEHFNIRHEVNAFWNTYWHQHAGQVQTLLIDVTDNYGGDSPEPYYNILFNRPYQEEYVRFNKIAEIERPDILQSLFWGDPGKEIWWRNIHHDGSFAHVATGDFLEPVPQFCADQNRDCREGLFAPRNHGFRGEVRVLTNPWCISSCVGFLYGMKTFFGPRMTIYGMADSGDSAFSRLSVFVYPDHSSVEALDAQGEPWVRQIVTVTRSTGPDGTLLSGRPQPVDHWVPKRWDQSDEDWAKAVFQAALPPEPSAEYSGGEKVWARSAWLGW